MTYIRLPVNKSKEKKEILLTRLPNHFTWSQMSKEAFTNYVPNVCPFLTTYLSRGATFIEGTTSIPDSIVSAYLLDVLCRQ